MEWIPCSTHSFPYYSFSAVHYPVTRCVYAQRGSALHATLIQTMLVVIFSSLSLARFTATINVGSEVVSTLEGRFVVRREVRHLNYCASL